MDHCNCHCHTSITRDGSGQLTRYLKALDPSYAPVDGRSAEELLVFIKRYAAQIRFYDIPGSSIEDQTPPDKISWKEFFRRDMAVLASSIALIDLDDLEKEYNDIRTHLDLYPDAEKFRALFDPIFGMAVRMDKWYALAIPGNPLHNELQLAIDSVLRGLVKKIASYEEGYKIVDPKKPLKLDYSGFSNETLWGLDDAINMDAGIYEGNTPEDKLRHAALFIDEIFFGFFGTLTRLVNESGDYMKRALENYPSHQPHMALFIAFLELFRIAQDQMNRITERMLNFYYRDVLHLTEKPSVPDHVYVVFELAKGVSAYDLAASTSLSAGKDSSGKDQVYLTEEDFVINQAVVKELKTIFIEKKTTATGTIINNIYARPVANSKDGMGEKFTDPQPKWPSFGQGTKPIEEPKNPCDVLDLIQNNADRKDETKIGFAIASPQFLMTGGNRLAGIYFKDLGTLLSRLDALPASSEPMMQILLTGEKGWVSVNKMMTAAEKESFLKYLDQGIFNPETNGLESSYFFNERTVNQNQIGTIDLYLPVSEQSIVAYDPQLHKDFSFTTNQPVVQFLFHPSLGLSESDFTSFSTEDLLLYVKVGSMNPDPEGKNNQGLPGSLTGYHFDGLKHLVLQNESGILPPNKPFDPFTAYPAPGKSFYIGSDEALNKNLLYLSINIMRTKQSNEGRLLDQGNKEEVFRAYLLQQKNWERLLRPEYIDKDTTMGHEYFTQYSLTSDILWHIKKGAAEDNTTSAEKLFANRLPVLPVSEWDVSTTKGFLRLDNLLTVDGNPEEFMQRSQNMAQELQIKEISLSYISLLSPLDPALDQIFHVYPFGIVEVYTKPSPEVIENYRGPKISIPDFNTVDKEKEYLLVDTRNRFFPQFTYQDSYDQLKPNKSIAWDEIKKQLGNSVSPQILDDLKALSEKNDMVRLMIASSGIQEKAVGKPNQYSGSLQEEGLLYIGLDKLEPLQTVSLLFQFAEGSAMDEDDDPPPIHWSYLSYNEWRPLKQEHIIHDGTYGFQTTGIIKIDVPEDINRHNTIITDGLSWFCASVSEHSERIPQLIDVVAQAVTASFQDNGNEPSHFDKPLPAGSIGKLTETVAEVSTVKQPFASFNGKHKEVGKEFYTRVSERLRHKARAVNAWDYEHLVLDHFPQIYKVKCISHTDPNCLCRNTEDEKSVQETKKSLMVIPIDEGFTINDDDKKRMLETVKGVKLTSKQLLEVDGYVVDKSQEALSAPQTKSLKELMMENGFSSDEIRIKDAVYENAKTGFEIFLIDQAEVDQEETCCGPQFAPGHVLVIPISNFKNRNAVNPLQPKTARRVLLEIQDYLKKRSSPFVRVHAKNPEYEQIIVSFKVSFYQGTDKGYYLKKLNEEIVHYLTPWAFDENAELRFDQKIYASSIINFIEERSYVDFITDFEMYVCRDVCCPPTKAGNTPPPPPPPPGSPPSPPSQAQPATSQSLADKLAKITGCADIECLLEEGNYAGDIVAKPSTPRSILVSVPQHIIIPYEEPPYVSPCEKRKSKATPQAVKNIQTPRPPSVPRSDPSPTAETIIKKESHRRTREPARAPAKPGRTKPKKPNK
ncbi:MAG: hypothetical protein ACJ75B_07910 [Flavisolibacter sp.]